LISTRLSHALDRNQSMLRSPGMPKGIPKGISCGALYSSNGAERGQAGPKPGGGGAAERRNHRRTASFHKKLTEGQMQVPTALPGDCPLPLPADGLIGLPHRVGASEPQKGGGTSGRTVITSFTPHADRGRAVGAGRRRSHNLLVETCRRPTRDYGSPVWGEA